MEVGKKHFLVAFAGALLLHLLVAGIWLWQAPPSGAVSSGLGGISVALGPAGGAPGTVAAESDATTEAEPVSPPDAEDQPVPEAVEPETAEPVETEQVEPTETQLVEEPVEQPIEPEPVENEQALDVEEVEAVEPDKVEPEKVEPAREVVAALPPPVKPRDLPRAPAPVRQPAPPPAPEVSEKPVEAASVAGSAGKSGTQAMPDTGSQQSNSSGGGIPGASADYLSMLQAWLENHKEYPRRARARGQEGTVLLRFVMDREGQVVEYGIVRSSGYELLDEAVVEMIQRASPLPPMPEEMQQASLELTIPVLFNLR